MLNKKVTHFFILHDENNNPFSGAENHLWELLKGMVIEGVKIELLVSVGLIGPFIKNKLDELKDGNVEISYIYRNEFLNGNENKYLKIAKELKRYYSEFRKRRDNILHLHLNTNTIPLTAVLAGHKNIFFSFHNDLPSLSNWYNRWLLSYFVNKFRHCIAITNHVKKFYTTAVKLDYQKITVVHYGINPPPLKDLSQFDIKRKNQELVIGFVGRLHDEQKNIYFLLDCIAQLRNVKLVIFGDGPDKDSVIAKINHLRINDKVEMFGYVQHASSYIPLFDFLCLPSKWEGLGLVLIEAMFQKVAIIGGNAGAIPEILVDGKLGFLIHVSDQQLAVESINIALTNPDIVKEKVQIAYDYAQTNYTVKKMCTSTLAIYENYAS